jgi:multicomponent Na+:H+ antiporter subunit E
VTLFVLNILLAIAWTALTGRFTPINLILGFVLGYAALWLTQRSEERTHYFGRVRRIIGFLFFFMWEVIKANLRVAYDVLSPKQKITPGIIAVPLEAKTDVEITILANLITLTPGTLSLDVSTDRRVLYIHAMYIKDVEQFRREIKEGLERRLLEVLR